MIRDRGRVKVAFRVKVGVRVRVSVSAPLHVVVH